TELYLIIPGMSRLFLISMYLGISEDVSRAKTNNSLKFPRDLPRLSAQMYLVLSKSGLSVDNQYLNLGSAHSDNNNLNGRLGYGEQDYGLAKKNRTLNMVATGGRNQGIHSLPES